MHPVLRDKLRHAVESPLFPPLTWTRRDVDLPRLAGKSLLVTSVRGAGLSSLLRQFLAARAREGTPRPALLHLDLDDDRLVAPSVADLDALLVAHAEAHPGARRSAGALIAIEGIRRVAGWPQWLGRRLSLEPGLQIVVAGTSTRLPEGLADDLPTLRLRPFSFREYLRYRWAEPTSAVDELADHERPTLQAHLERYLREGGMPAVQGKSPEEANSQLRQLLDVALLRDVIDRHAVSNPRSLRRLQRRLLRAPTEDFSVQRLLKDLKEEGLRVAKDTLHTYLDHLEEAGMVETVCVETSSERQRRLHPRRVFPADPALVGLLADDPASGIEAALRTAVFHELRRRGYRVTYLLAAAGDAPADSSGAGEGVDFLARARGRDPMLIQVCAASEDSPLRASRRLALRRAAAAHPTARARLVTLEGDGPSADEPSRASAATWLLGPSPGRF